MPDAAPRAWASPDLPLYVAVPARGLFHVHINPGRLEPLALHPGWSVTTAKIVGGGRYLLYQMQRKMQTATWVYDFRQGADHALPTLPGLGQVLVSDDGVWAAAQTGRRFGDPALAFVNLTTGHSHSAPGPFGSASADGLFDLDWTPATHSLTFRTTKNDQVWIIDADRGKAPVMMRRPSIGTDHRLTPFLVVPTNFALAGGGSVESDGAELVIHRPRLPPKIVARAAPAATLPPGQVPLACGGPAGIGLLHVFNNDLVLFRVGMVPRIYGIAADRTATLPIAPGWALIW